MPSDSEGMNQPQLPLAVRLKPADDAVVKTANSDDAYALAAVAAEAVGRLKVIEDFDVAQMAKDLVVLAAGAGVTADDIRHRQGHFHA